MRKSVNVYIRSDTLEVIKNHLDSLQVPKHSVSSLVDYFLTTYAIKKLGADIPEWEQPKPGRPKHPKQKD